MRNAVVGLIALAASAAPALALDGPGRALVASDNLQAGIPGPFMGTGGNQTSKSFTVPYLGTVRVKWEMRSSDGEVVAGDAQTRHLSFCSKTTTSMTFVPQSCDIRVASGFPVELRVYPTVGGSDASVRNIRIYYNVVDFDGKTIDYELPR